MTKLFTIRALAALGMTMAATQAMAADTIDEIPVPPEAVSVPALPVDMWAGAYGGVYGQWADGKFDTSVGDIDADGFGGGAFVGFNQQIGTFVYGVEGDLGYNGTDGTLGGFAAETGVNGSLRARLGIALDPVLLYGTAGIAATDAEVAAPTGTDSNTHIGWTAGVGADALVTENVFGRLEYRYTDFSGETYNLGGTQVSSGFDEHSVRAGIGLKF